MIHQSTKSCKELPKLLSRFNCPVAVTYVNRMWVVKPARPISFYRSQTH